MSKRKSPYSKSSSSSSSQPISALSQRQELLNQLQILNTRKETLQKTPRPGGELESILKKITDIEAFLGMQEEATDIKPVQPFSKKQRQVDEKKGERSRKSTLTLDIMPMVLLVYTASFLTKTSLAHLTLVSKLFLIVDWEDARRSYRKELVDFYQLRSQYGSVISSIDSHDALADVQSWRLFKKTPEQSRLFSTLIDQALFKSYTPLFMALLSSDQESAIDFINYKLKSTAHTTENVTDLVFLQKKWDGETAIMLANRLGLQRFLTHCFNGCDFFCGALR